MYLAYYIIKTISDMILNIISMKKVNTKAADILYQNAIDLSSPKDNSTIIDICCGTGTIGLCFSKVI